MQSVGDNPKAVEASAESARYLLPNLAQTNSFAVSRIVMYSRNSGDMRTIFAAKWNNTAAWSRDCAVEYSCEFGCAFGPTRCTNTINAHKVVFAFLRPIDNIARRTGRGAS